MLQIGLAVAGSGIFNASWTLAALFKRVARLDRSDKTDESGDDDESGMCHFRCTVAPNRAFALMAA